MTHFQLALVYDWAENGNICQYILSHPHAPRSSLLLDVAMGLEYLHRLDIPHGDVKGENVVIDQNINARLTGYGLAPVNSDPGFTASATYESLENSRWLAPEIIRPSRKRNSTATIESKAADVFAFGMLAVEIFTGKLPFGDQESDAVVLLILGGVRPKMPENAQEVGPTVEMWKLFESYWRQNPKKRPTMEVVMRLRKFVGNINGDGKFVFE